MGFYLNNLDDLVDESAADKSKRLCQSNSSDHNVGKVAREEFECLSRNCGEVSQRQSKQEPDASNHANKRLLTNEEDAEEDSTKAETDERHQSVETDCVQKCSKDYS